MVLEMLESFNDEIESLKNRFRYEAEDTYPEKDLNMALNNWIFLDKFETELCEDMYFSLDVILYSKYYWFTQFKNKNDELYGVDAGLNQHQFKIIEYMTSCLDYVDWDFIKNIEDSGF